MATSDTTISSYFLQAVLSKASQQGLDISRLLARAGIPRKFFAQPISRVTADRFASLQMLTMREMKDEMLGYFETPVPLGSWYAMCHWLITSRNIYHALKRVQHFQHITQSCFRLSIASSGSTLSLQVNVSGKNARIEPYGYELYLFSLHRQLCWLVSENIPIQQVLLPYDRPDHFSEYRLLFPRAEIHFNSPQCQLKFSSGVRELAVEQTTENLAEFLKQPLLNLIVNDYSHQSWTERTKAMLEQHLESCPTMVEIASLLDVHPKKFRRQLELEGSQYADLKAQLRRDIAIRLLTRSSDSVESISRKLGFAECSTFTRAFKHWTGASPFNYRQLMR